MPLAHINYDAAKVSQAVVGRVVRELAVALAVALTCDGEGGGVTPGGVRVFVYERSSLDVSAWDLDITVMANDLPERHNLQERLATVSRTIDVFLKEQASGVGYCLWANLHGPFAFFESEQRSQ